MNKFFEFQSKGTSAPEFTLKNGVKKIKFFADGERIIAKVLEEKMIGNKMMYQIEDTEGDISTIFSYRFHKIINPKNFSLKFKNFKIANHIVD